MTTTSADFAPASEAAWRSLVAKTAGGDAARLASTSEDGIGVGPIYGPAAAAPLPFPRRGPWRIVQRIDRADAGAAIADIRADREGGVAAFDLVFATSPVAFDGGLTLSSAGAIAGAFDATAKHVRIDAGERTAEVLRSFPGGTAFFDPVATLAAQGFLARPVEAHMRSGAATLADGRVWNAGGTTDGEELASVLATLAEYLRRGVRDIRVALAADADQFLTIAKFRAMRLLHARLREVAGLPPARLDLHAETSWRMMSRLDQHTNILRATMAVFSAGIGGADSVTALPFDAANRTGDPFARRIARNSQNVLLFEAALGHVEDPGAGAGAVEHLTGEYARVAWDRFREIEAEGGILAAVRSGSLQRAIATARDRRLAAVRDGALKLTGVNAYPDRGATPLASLPAGAPPSLPGTPAETVEPLRFVRLSEPVEEARL
jgi:methylmalonyl-CoA mutase